MSEIELIVVGTAAVLFVFFVHELGHLLMARYLDVGVLGISMGFGPEIVGFVDRLGTRWSLAAIPFGAYLKMVDENGQSPGSIASARLDVDQKSKSLSSRSLVQRAAIFGAGSAANILLALVVYCFSAIYFWGTLTWPNKIDLDSALVLIFCSLSFLVGVFNLLPIPSFDGAKLMVLGSEWLRGNKTS